MDPDRVGLWSLSGSPVEKFWEEPVSRVSTAVSEQIIRWNAYIMTQRKNDAENNRKQQTQIIRKVTCRFHDRIEPCSEWSA
jgi:hypothetical protein